MHTIYHGEIKHASVAATDSADLIAAVTSASIVVLSYKFVLTTATSVKFQTGAATDITGAMDLAAKSHVDAPFNPAGHFKTASGAKLNVVLGAPSVFSGHITYQVVF